ncbi:MAG: NUDIX hydrolase [Patescibacteria group bacterium]
MTKKIQQLSVKGLFRRGGNVLLVKDPKGVWELPGGRIKHGEEPEEALRRELDEELGWSKVDIKNIINTWSFSSKINGTYYHFIIIIYTCTSDEENIKKNDEYIKYQWVPISEINNLNMRDGYKKICKL